MANITVSLFQVGLDYLIQGINIPLTIPLNATNSAIFDKWASLIWGALTAGGLLLLKAVISSYSANSKFNLDIKTRKAESEIKVSESGLEQLELLKLEVRELNELIDTNNKQVAEIISQKDNEIHEKDLKLVRLQELVLNLGANLKNIMIVVSDRYPDMKPMLDLWKLNLKPKDED